MYLCVFMCICVSIRDGQNDSFPGTSSFSSVQYNDSFIFDSFVLIRSSRQITSFGVCPAPRETAVSII